MPSIRTRAALTAAASALTVGLLLSWAAPVPAEAFCHGHPWCRGGRSVVRSRSPEAERHVREGLTRPWPAT